MSTEVSDQPEKSRYELRVDGELAGFAEYKLRGDHITFTHTEVDDAYEGQGLGSQLSRAVLDGAHDAGLSVYPECAFIARYVKRHPGKYLGLVPEDVRATYGL